MLQIRPRTYSIFQSNQKDRFVDRMRKFLMAHFEDEREISESIHRERIVQLTQKAGCYGLTTERQVAGYIVLSKTRGIGFDEGSASQRILKNPSLDGDCKIEKLVRSSEHQVS